jgi:DNA-binding Xre family transcriptional regulator
MGKTTNRKIKETTIDKWNVLLRKKQVTKTELAEVTEVSRATIHKAFYGIASENTETKITNYLKSK